MRRIPIILASLAVPALVFAQGWTFAGKTGTAQPMYDHNAPAEPQVPKIYAAWKAERDPSRRAELGRELVDAIIHEVELPQTDIADEVARDGRPIRLITPVSREKIALKPLVTLAGVHSGDDAWPASPLFRRIADDRIEAWTSSEGWLFDGKGNLLAHVKVPRRDGTGREWFGAFLPDGTWITTDLWEQDEQINAFSARGKWLWEVKGADILKQLPPAARNGDDTPSKPLICWARADRIGQGWVVCVGEDWNTTCALVAESRTVAPVPGGESAWDLVYPRAMGTRGFFIALAIPSDDGKLDLTRNEAGHGPGVGWPTYSVTPGSWSRTIRGGYNRFGFWPRSHALFIEAEGDELIAPHRVWFFDDAGRYSGEIAGSYLGDAANKYGLLVTLTGGGVATLMQAPKGPSITQVRAFTCPDGTRAVPLALYDDLHLGFFLRGPELTDPNAQTASRARSSADIVLAKWRQ
ncbi:MAG TPA: hypothetical protein VHY09_06420 [Candidatus Methylacidiphilales bacterium]|jgi:hypothetical protein|nr:hypothetical protein [Candidatus Methylacidiphilales bacterium]